MQDDPELESTSQDVLGIEDVITDQYQESLLPILGIFAICEAFYTENIL